MPTQSEILKSLVDARITNKITINSISPGDVGGSIKDVIDRLKISVPSMSATYDAGVLGRDVNFNLYMCILQGANGDLDNPSKWRRIFYQNKYELTVTTPGQTLFTLTPIPLNINLVSLYLNGQRLSQFRDFTVDSFGVLTYSNGTVSLATDDILETEYFT